jgi:hypothetical protein
VKLFALILPLLLAGCGLTTHDVAVVSANETREFGSQEHDAIESFCTPRYEAAESLKDVDQVDKVCQPAKVSYLAVRLAWGLLVDVLEAEKNGGATQGQVEEAARQLGIAFADLRVAAGGLK